MRPNDCGRPKDLTPEELPRRVGLSFCDTNAQGAVRECGLCCAVPGGMKWGRRAGKVAMGTTLGRIGAAMAVAVLSVALCARSYAAPLQVEPSVRWSIQTSPTCPSLHGDSFNGGQGLFAIQAVDSTGFFYQFSADVRPGQPYVLDLSSLPEDPGVLIRQVAVFNVDVGDDAAQWQNVQVFCTGATAPFAPRSGAATPGNRSATVSWLPPLSNGGAPIQYYEVNMFVGDQPTGTHFPSTTTDAFTSLTNGVEYRFEPRAYNDIGYSPISKVKRSITAGTPTAPTIGTATAGNGSATVSWTPPATDNGSPILAYVVTAYVGYDPAVSVLAGPAATSRTIPGLTPGTTYQIRVRPHNAWGAGLFSTVSNAVTPT